MPLYPFEDVETGARVEEFLSMSQAPEIGSVVEIDGRRLRRIVTAVAVGQGAPSRSSAGKKRSLHMGPRHGGHFESHQLPRWDPRAPRHDTDGSLTGVPGKCLFDNMNEVREACSKSEDLGLGKLNWSP